MQCEINAVRAAHRLPAIKTTRALRVAAQRHSEDMVRRQYFAHVSPNGLTLSKRVRRAGYSGDRVGENIGWGSGSAATPAAIVQAWMNSPPHRQILLTRAFRSYQQRSRYPLASLARRRAFRGSSTSPA